MVSSVLWRLQYKDETPNQSLKLKNLNVVSSVLSKVQNKHETPNQSLKFNPKRGLEPTLKGAIQTWNPKPIPKTKNPKRGL